MPIRPLQQTAAPTQWNKRRLEKNRRLALVRDLADGPVLRSGAIVAALELLIAPGDRVVLEGNNQKQADFLARALAQVDSAKVNHGRSRHHMPSCAVLVGMMISVIAESGGTFIARSALEATAAKVGAATWPP